MYCPSLKELPLAPGERTGWVWTEECQQLPDTMAEGKLWPMISIVTPSYNQGHFIEKAIRSVLLQGYPNIEYFVIDGKSNDNSVQIIKKYEAWFTYWVTESDEGQSDAVNKGFERASGQIFVWINSDDYLLPNSLRTIAEAYYRAPNAGGWFGSCERVALDGAVACVRHPNRLDFEGLADKGNNWIMQPSCFFSAQAWNACGPLDTSLSYAMDFDLWLKIAKHYRIEKVDAVLAAACIHDEAKTQAERGMMFAEIWTVQIRHGFEDLAIQKMSDLWEEHRKLRKKIDRIQCSFLYRLMRPFLEPLRKKLFIGKTVSRR